MTIVLTKEQFERHLAEDRQRAIRTNPPEIMNAQEVALFIDAHVETVYILAAEGKIPARKEGRILKFLRDEIRPWAKSWKRV